MKKIIVLMAVLTGCLGSWAQLSVRYDPSLQRDSGLQYFKPAGKNLFVGDCIPFYNKGTYYLYWLIDSAHHSALNGLGGHQWVLSTTKDLRHWKHQPIVIGIDEEWEKSICTGSVVFYKDKYYAFYATRLVNDGKVNEQLSYAISDDGVHFKKQKPNPFYTSAPGYSKRNFRDPKVTVDGRGRFHLFIASEKDSAKLKGTEGCLVHLVSTDLKNWEVKDPVLTGQGSVPECPDYFYWNGWYYLVYSDNSNTYYVKSRNAYGPWEQPAFQALNEDWSNVVKVAAFGRHRFIAAGWVPSRKDNKDEGGEIFGGNMVFRELGQEPDGTLTTKFPAEMIVSEGALPAQRLIGDSQTTETNDQNFSIAASGAVGAAQMEQVPANCRITLTAEPVGANENYGLYLRSNPDGSGGYQLSVDANNGTVSLFGTTITGVRDLNKAVALDIVMQDDIIDVCINGRRCIVTRAIENKGGSLYFYAKHGTVKFSSVKLYPMQP